MKNYDEWKTTNPTDDQLGSDRYILSEVAAREIAQQLEDNREKDVEIERLKGLILALGESKILEIERLEAENNYLRLDAVENRRLITELCDKFDEVQREFDSIDQSIWRAYDVPEIVQRAREATR